MGKCKFKVGDIVVGNAYANDKYTITKEGFEAEVTGSGKDNLIIRASKSSGFYPATFIVKPKYFDLKSSKAQKIVIDTDGTKVTTARLYEGKKVLKKASARCNPSNKFDFDFGAKLALYRLIGHEPIDAEPAKDPAWASGKLEGSLGDEGKVGTETDLKDSSGRALHVGDIVHVRAPSGRDCGEEFVCMDFSKYGYVMGCKGKSRENPDFRESDWRVELVRKFDALTPGETVDGVTFISDAKSDFGEALKWLRNGCHVARRGWNGRHQWVALQTPGEHSKMRKPYLYICPVDGEFVPWLASQTDMLADDWYIVH